MREKDDEARTDVEGDTAVDAGEEVVVNVIDEVMVVDALGVAVPLLLSLGVWLGVTDIADDGDTLLLAEGETDVVAVGLPLGVRVEVGDSLARGDIDVVAEEVVVIVIDGVMVVDTLGVAVPLALSRGAWLVVGDTVMDLINAACRMVVGSRQPRRSTAMSISRRHGSQRRTKLVWPSVALSRSSIHASSSQRNSRNIG